MTVHSAGMLLYRRDEGGNADGLQVLLVHPGGPFYVNKDDGSWSIPKGEYDPAHETALSAARREFVEETGGALDEGSCIELGWIEQRKGKIVHAFAFEGSFDVDRLTSNEFELEWPPRSGRVQSFPEVDRAQWFTPDEARGKILPPQRVFVDRLVETLEGGHAGQAGRVGREESEDSGRP